MTLPSSEMLPCRLRADDPELPTLATRAAVELDSLRQGKAGDLASVRRLSELLRNSLGESPRGAIAGREVACLMDPPTVVLVARAFCGAGTEPGPSTQDLCDLARNMADKLDQAALLHDVGTDASLRQFCIELARGVHRQPGYRRDPDLRPFRR